MDAQAQQPVDAQAQQPARAQVQRKAGCTRTVLLIFLFTFGPITIMVGYVTGNPLLTNVAFSLIAYIVAIVSVGIFEEVLDAGLGRFDQFAAQVIDLLNWLRKQIARSSVSYTILGIVLAMLLITPHITPEVHATACIQTPLRLLCGDGIGVTALSIDHNGAISANGSLINIGIIDEYTAAVAPFDQYDTSNALEKSIENHIFQENRLADASGQYFTLAVATTLSRAVTDNGLSASVGLDNLRGAYLAQHDYNSDSSHTSKLRLLIANIGVKFSAPTTAPLVAAQLVLYAKNGPATAHFLGVVGFPFSVTAQDALPTLQQSDILTVSPSASSDQLSKEPDFYRIELPDGQQSQDIQNFISNVLRPKRVVVLYDGSDPYSQSLGYTIIQSLTREPLTVSTQNYRVGHPDTLDGPLNSIMSQKPDLLFFSGYSDDLNAFKEKLKEQQRQGKTLPGMRIMGAQALYELGGYTDDNYSSIYFATFAFPDVPNPATKVDFAKEYAATFDPAKSHLGEYGYSRAGPDSALAYDAVTAFLQAIEQTSSNMPTPDMVKTAMMSISFEGVTGLTTFNGRNPLTSSDPTDKPLYIACVNSKGLTQELTVYGPGSKQQQPHLDVCA